MSRIEISHEQWTGTHEGSGAQGEGIKHALAAAQDRERAAAADAAKRHVPVQPTRINGTTTIFKGQATTVNHAQPGEGRAPQLPERPVRKGNVLLPVIGEMTPEGAMNAGFISRGWTEGTPFRVSVEGRGVMELGDAVKAGYTPRQWKPLAGFNQPAASNFGQAAGQHSAAQSAPTTTVAPNGPEGANDEPEPTSDAYKGHKASVEASTATLTALDGTLGAEVVTAALNQAVQTGELDLSALPEGVTEDQAQTIYDGYLAVADNALAQIGANVETLSQMLTDQELQVARGAAVDGSGELLRELGSEALGRLAHLPRQDPARFQALLDDMHPEERNCIRQDRNGAWAVHLPNQQPIPFAMAVRQGIARF